jgi:hypothetical protein
MLVVSNRIQVSRGFEKEFEERFAGRANYLPVLMSSKCTKSSSSPRKAKRTSTLHLDNVILLSHRARVVA